MTRLTTPRRPAFWMLLTILSISTAGSNALAQFTQTNLVTNVQDPNLVNAWGLAYGAGSPFWVSDEGTGKSTVYDASGTIVSLVVTIPAATSGPKGTPTGIVANPTSGFVIAQSGTSGAAAFIFDTMDGTISGWNPSVNAGSAVIAVNNHATANYTGLAIATLAGKSFLYAANNAKNQIEVYNSSFKLVKTFADASLTGFSVYGVQAIKNNLYVTFSGTAGGAVDVFSLSGTLVKTVRRSAERAVGSGAGTERLRSFQRRTAGGKRRQWTHQCIQLVHGEVQGRGQGYNRRRDCQPGVVGSAVWRWRGKLQQWEY
jgi:hypothetical protein